MLRGRGWRRGADSNRRIEVLQTSPLASWVPRPAGIIGQPGRPVNPNAMCVTAEVNVVPLENRWGDRPGPQTHQAGGGQLLQALWPHPARLLRGRFRRCRRTDCSLSNTADDRLQTPQRDRYQPAGWKDDRKTRSPTSLGQY